MTASSRVANWRKKNPEKAQRLRLAERCRRYGITVEDYEALLLNQKGLCGICGKPPSGKNQLAVDHDHATGKVRGLLCTVCNGWLGFVEKYLPAAQAYLRGEKWTY